MRIEEPLVSVMIPCYNHENFVQASIQSVIDQTYKNIELIIIDDGSKDGSIAKIKEMTALCEQRFVNFEFRFRPNKGLSATLNEALEWCRGEYFSVIASDDIMLKNKTKTQVVFLESNAGVVAVSGGIQLVDELNNKLDIEVRKSREYVFKDIIMHKFHLPAPSQMLRLETVKRIGGYNPEIIIEDWYMWLKLSEVGRVFYISDIFALYRQHDSNFSNNTEKKLQGREDVIRCFPHSKHYEKALRKIKWLNARVYFYHSRDEKMKWLKELYCIWPTKTLNMLINEVVKKIRNKQ